MVELSRDFDATAWSVLERVQSTSGSESDIRFDHPPTVPEGLLAAAREVLSAIAKSP